MIGEYCPAAKLPANATRVARRASLKVGLRPQGHGERRKGGGLDRHPLLIAATIRGLSTDKVFAEIQEQMRASSSANKTEILQLHAELLDVREVVRRLGGDGTVRCPDARRRSPEA